MNSSSTIETAGGKASLLIFSILQIVGGQAGMIFILFTSIASSEKVRRHPCFINFIISWFLYSLSYCLLLYGGELYNPEPSRNLCVAQAAFTYGAAPMASFSSLMFVLQIYLSLNRILSSSVVPRSSAWNLTLLFIMLGTPYLILVAMLIAVPIYASHHPTEVQRLHFYCHISKNKFANIPPGIAAVGILAALGVLAMIFVKVYRHRRSFRRLYTGGQDVTIGILIRALLFTGFSIIAVLVCAVLIGADDKGMLASGIFLALLPFAVFIVFGIQQNICTPFRRPSQEKESLRNVIRVPGNASVPIEVTITQIVSKSSTL